ncbi:alpha/beta fold hydrolase [Nocardia sp. NBC_00511]|uniref:alpha/beta fold hydrolase n=1 Tax=Nocardia sp. NBC_00511 TaxID=2903591 RepID=UPI0030E1E430
MNRRNILVGSIVGAAALAAGAACSKSDDAKSSTSSSSAAAAALSQQAKDTTVVLVHGAGLDGSSWAKVSEQLRADGYQVTVPANPLRSIGIDSDYIGKVVGAINGPVVLVAHSYGGAIITEIGAKFPNVKGLVYSAAFAPDAGESCLSIVSAYPPNKLAAATVPSTYTVDIAGAQVPELLVDPAKFPGAFAEGLPEALAKELAASGRPATPLALDGKVTEAAWKTVPSWFVVTTEDQAIPPDAQKMMSARANPKKVVEVASPHLVALAHPDKVVAVIREAVG